MELLVPLTNEPIPWALGKRYNIFALPLKDYGGVPPNWRELLNEVIGELRQGRSLLAFCVGGHGRTGCFVGSLIALLESAEETPDPIKAVRERHCTHAVETRAQATAIFALRGEALPQWYVDEFDAREKLQQQQQS